MANTSKSKMPFFSTFNTSVLKNVKRPSTTVIPPPPTPYNPCSAARERHSGHCNHSFYLLSYLLTWTSGVTRECGPHWAVLAGRSKSAKIVFEKFT